MAGETVMNRNATADEIKRAFVRDVKPILNCPVCGNEYKQNRPWQKFCSTDCKIEWRLFVKRSKWDES